MIVYNITTYIGYIYNTPSSNSNRPNLKDNIEIRYLYQNKKIMP
jgi:hypothetical protein